MKVFISQTMRDQKPEEILKIREAVIKELVNKYGTKVIVLDSYKPELKSANPITALSKSIAILAGADTIACVRMGGVPTSRGCKIEESIAFEYGIKRLNVYVNPINYAVDIRATS